MHAINTGKEHVVFAPISADSVNLLLKECEILFEQDVILSSQNNQKAKMIIVKKDDPSEIISKRVGINIRPADRAFIHSVDCKFVQMQEILVGFVLDENEKEVTLFLCRVTDIIPNGYLR